MKLYDENKNVLEATWERLDIVFNEFDNICISLSGGKDSSVMYQLAIMKAKQYNKKIDVMYIDMEAQYLITLEHIKELTENEKMVKNFWHICLPLSLRNAVSIFEPRWICWEEEKKEKWIRELPENSINIKDNLFEEFYEYGMEFEEFVPKFEKWYEEKNDGLSAHLVGIRSDESLNRWRTIASNKKTKYKDYQWTTFNKSLQRCYSVYPIYDWRTQDIWTAVAKLDLKYNEVYELMYKNGVSIHEQRLCQPFGDDQKNGLDQYKSIESENWEKLLNRVAGVNFGNIYCRTSALGNIKSEKPDHLSWQEWSLFLLESIGIYNERLEKHYADRIRKFIKYWDEKCGCSLENIKDFSDLKLESEKRVASWRRIGRALERNDFFMSRLSFGQTKSDVILLKELVEKWDNILTIEETNSTPLKREFLKIKEEIGEKNEK
jgi:predicted phosphoadenosine phosphosulfate sulfurtransferase